MKTLHAFSELADSRGSPAFGREDDLNILSRRLTRRSQE